MPNLKPFSPLIHVGLMGCGGYLSGKLTGYSPELIALTFAITCIARHCFNYCCAFLQNSLVALAAWEFSNHVANFIGTMAAYRLHVINNILEGIGLFLILEGATNLSDYATTKIIEATR